MRSHQDGELEEHNKHPSARITLIKNDQQKVNQRRKAKDKMAEGHYSGREVDTSLYIGDSPLEPQEDNTPVTRGAAKRKGTDGDPDPKKQKHLPSTSAPRGTQTSQGKLEIAVRMLEQVQRTQDLMREENKTYHLALNNRLKVMEETIVRIQQECNTRLGVLEARVTALQSARRDQAVEALIAPVAQPSAPITTPHIPSAPKGGGFFTTH